MHSDSGTHCFCMHTGTAQYTLYGRWLYCFLNVLYKGEGVACMQVRYESICVLAGICGVYFCVFFTYVHLTCLLSNPVQEF